MGWVWVSTTVVVQTDWKIVYIHTNRNECILYIHSALRFMIVGIWQQKQTHRIVRKLLTRGGTVWQAWARNRLVLPENRDNQKTPNNNDCKKNAQNRTAFRYVSAKEWNFYCYYPMYELLNHLNYPWWLTDWLTAWLTGWTQPIA